MLWIDFGSPVLQRWSTTYRKQDPLKWFSKQLAQINPQRDHKPVRAELRVCIYFLSEYSTNCTRSNSLPFVRKIKVRLKKNSITMRRFYTHTHTHTHTHTTHTRVLSLKRSDNLLSSVANTCHVYRITRMKVFAASASDVTVLPSLTSTLLARTLYQEVVLRAVWRLVTRWLEGGASDEPRNIKISGHGEACRDSMMLCSWFTYRYYQIKQRNNQFYINR